MNDKKEIINCVLNYVEGWYEANPERMNKALSKYLVKRRVVSDEEIWDINKEWMINATKEGRGKIEKTVKGMKKVRILDRTDRIATVKLISEKFTDYLHLVKISDKWEIVNVLWEYLEGVEK